MEKRNLAVIYGGDSSEWEISVQSGKFVASSIDRSKYNVYEILQRGPSWKLQLEGHETEVDKSDFSIMIDGVRIKFDLAFIMIHGTPGENGLMQAYFEMLRIPFNTCSSFVSSVTFDKYACKGYLIDCDIDMADSVLINKGDAFSSQEICDRLRLPLFVKPTDGGSSFGVTKVKSVEDFDKAVADAFKEGKRVMAESFIPGREFSNGVYRDNGKIHVLPVTEIVPHSEFFDYDAKYLGKSDEICPAPIEDELRDRIQAKTELIYKYLGCDGLVRIDYIVPENGDIYFLEMNTVPGMTAMSIVPKQVRTEGMDITDFFNTLIDNIE